MKRGLTLIGLLVCALGTRLLAQTPQKKAAADRKSTRLNSSHLVISYAVFCLKKKNVGIAARGPDSALRCRLTSGGRVALEGACRQERGRDLYRVAASDHRRRHVHPLSAFDLF